MEVARPGVVAEPLPEFEHLVLGGGGQGADIGKALRKAQVVVHTLCHARLLEDYLGKPDAVGVAGPAPRQVAPFAGVPVKQYVGDTVHHRPQKYDFGTIFGGVPAKNRSNMEKNPHTVTDNTARHRYELELDGDVAILEYEEQPGCRILTHTIVPPRFEGQGIGRELVEAALQDIRDRGLRFRPLCSFIIRYVERHPEWAALVDKGR